MVRKHAPLIILISLIALVTTACIVRTSRPPGQRSQPVYIEDHKDHKGHKKHKKHKHKKHKHKKHR
ncbi:MAG TPA: hypothetical protein VK932_15220 [Kofleriaceae bacterium]|nr:hypothetical protein [Kofleriaceae bacterium]